MKLSKRGEYGLRALVYLARNPGRHVRLAEIARAEKIPPRFLEQIFGRLRTGGILDGRRGPDGGYRLRREPRKVTLGEVVRRLDGPLAPIRCVSRSEYAPCTCPDEKTCRLRAAMGEVRDAIARILDRTTLDDLVRPRRILR